VFCSLTWHLVLPWHCIISLNMFYNSRSCNDMICKSTNVVYSLKCNLCGFVFVTMAQKRGSDEEKSDLYYVGKTKWRLNPLVCVHRSGININKNQLPDVYLYFRLIESNTGDRSRSRNLRHPRVSEISRSWPVIGVWLFILHRHPTKFFFLCGEILLGCVLFGHISWNEYIWQWTRSPFDRTIWLGKSI